MFESSVEECYKNNAIFKNLVDILRSELRRYDTTPRELREAAMLAATMHESENIKPMLIHMNGFRSITQGDYWQYYIPKYSAILGDTPGLLAGVCIKEVLPSEEEKAARDEKIKTL
jgi:hypothetical protein